MMESAVGKSVYVIHYELGSAQFTRGVLKEVSSEGIVVVSDKNTLFIPFRVIQKIKY